MKEVEFIESYIKVGNDYQWHDNHGELIRCKDCHGYDATTGRCHWWYDDPEVSSDGYCYQAVRKEE